LRADTHHVPDAPMKARTDLVLTSVSTLCLVVLVALLVRREFLPPEPLRPSAPPSRVAAWDAIVASSHLIAGEPSADVVLLEFTDLQCPACKRFHEGELPGIIAQLGSSMSVRVAHLPLRSHPQAMAAAVAAECAGGQGRFPEFLASAFKRQEQFGADSIWLTIAREADLPDIDRYVECISRDDRSVVTRSLALAEAAGIRATPTFLINGWRDLVVPQERSIIKALRQVSDSLAGQRRRAR